MSNALRAAARAARSFPAGPLRAPAFITLSVSLLLSGCASVLNGPGQWIRVESDEAGALLLRDTASAPLALPAEILLRRADEGQSLRLVYPRADTGEKEGGEGRAGRDTVRVDLERDFNLATLTNGFAGLLGFAGAVVDFRTGALWRQDLALPRQVPPDARIDFNPHPWSTGAWQGSLAWVAGFKSYPAGFLAEGATAAGDFGAQLVLARRGWPLAAETRAYFLSSLEEAPGENRVLLEVGPRKSWGARDLRPYLSGGLALLERGTLPHGGLPAGFWTRAGLDIRFGSAGLLAPYIGYSKHEAVLSHGDTHGFTGGLQAGIVW